MNNMCIACGVIIPEGKQICPACINALKNYTVVGAKTKTIKKFIMRGAEQTDE